MKNTMFRRSMMRASMLTLCAALVGTVPMVAQDNSAPPPPQQQEGGQGGRGGRMGGERMLEMMTKQLNLTPDQVTQVKAINEDTMKQSMAVRDDSSVTDKRGKMMEIRKASQDKIRALLNDDQKTKYDAMLEEMRNRRGNRGGGDNAPPPPPPPQQ